MDSKFYTKYIELKPDEGSPAVFPKTVAAALLEIFKLNPWRWSLLFLANTIGAVLEPFTMWLLGQFADDLSSGSVTASNALTHPALLSALLIFLLAFPLFGAVEAVLSNLVVNPKLAQRSRFRAMTYLTHQSMEFFHNEMAGRLSAKVFDFGRTSADLMLNVITNAWWVTAFFISTVALASTIHWALVALLAGWAVSTVIISWIFTPILAERSDRLTESYSTALGRCVDIITNISLTKLFSKPEDENIGFASLLNQHLENSYSKNKAMTLATSLLDLVNGVFMAGIGAVAVYLWSESVIAVGSVVTMFPLILRLRIQMVWFFMQASMISENYGTIKNGLEVLNRPVTVLDKPDAAILPRVKGEIVFKDVKFIYPSGRTIFENLNLHIPAGQKVGLVGPSGSGKTTLINMLLRSYDIQSGSVTIDGYDIQSVTQNSLRAQIGMVTQEPALLNRSITENLTYGRTDASEEEILKATEQAAAHEFILSLRDQYGNTGYASRVGERGVKLSGGQRQRVAIARLILKDAPIMLLDEATSALDSEIEAAVQSTIYPLMEHRTVIAIAHRLSTVMQMDRLIVMENGLIVEDGTHASLLAKGGLYARLWARQSQGFLPE